MPDAPARQRRSPAATRTPVPDPPGAPSLPPGYLLTLPGRGVTFVRDQPGPPGAPTLLLLHGLGATADLNWWYAYGPLGRRYRVIAIDHRGHGRGIRARQRFNLADCADDAAAAAEALGVERFIPVGYSMGGPIAQLIWRRHHDKVAGLVLCATSRDFRGSPRERASFGLLAGLALAARAMPWNPGFDLATRVLALRAAGEPYGPWMVGELRRSTVSAIVEAAASLGRFTSRTWIGGVDVPVAVVATTHDSLVPVRRQVKLALSIPTATMHVVRSDHFLAPRDRDTFLQVLEDACDTVTMRIDRPAHAPPYAPAASDHTG